MNAARSAIPDNNELKDQVKSFWDRKSCGEVYGGGDSGMEFYESQSRARFAFEPYIIDFADCASGRGKDVLEIGVGMGADHRLWAEANPRSLTGIDLTPRAVAHTMTLFSLTGHSSRLLVGDAERLPFPDASFDIAYSWGVLHHSPDTSSTVRELHRVLRDGGTARIMIYHRYSLTGYMLWLRYGLMAGHPRRSLEYIYHHYMESPGTKAFSVAEGKALFSPFRDVRIRTRLSFGDLLQGAVGQRHDGVLLRVAKRIWPRPLIRLIFARRGILMLIEATK